MSNITFPVLMGVLTLLVMVVAAILILLSKKKEDIHLTETKRADANERLLKVRDVELAECEVKKKSIEEELEETTAEYRTLAAIKIVELMNYWSTREEELANIDNLKAEVRRLKKRLEAREAKDAD